VKPTVAYLLYGTIDGGWIANHQVPLAFEELVVAYNHTTHGVLPRSRKYGHGVHFDPGGMVCTDTPVVRVRLPGYSARCKLDHLPSVVPFLADRIQRGERCRIHVASGRTIITMHGTLWSVAVPLDDAKTILRAFRRRVDEGAAVRSARRALLASEPHIHLEGGLALPEIHE